MIFQPERRPEKSGYKALCLDGMCTLLQQICAEMAVLSKQLNANGYLAEEGGTEVKSQDRETWSISNHHYPALFELVLLIVASMCLHACGVSPAL